MCDWQVPCHLSHISFCKHSLRCTPALLQAMHMTGSIAPRGKSLPLSVPNSSRHGKSSPAAGAKERYFQEKERLDHALAVLREGAEKVHL